MRRYLATVRLFWLTAIAAEMEYRLNFILAAIGSVMTLGGALFSLRILFDHDYQMGGWSWPQALMVMAIYTLLDGIQQAVLAPNRTRVTELVRQGTLDFVLLKPIDTQFWLSTRQVSVWGVPNMLLGLGLLFYAGSQLTPPLGANQYLIGLVPLFIGVTILYSLGYLLGTFTVWFVKMDNITITMQSLLEAGRYPIPAYPWLYRVLFTFVLPVAFMTTVPAQTMIDPQGATTWILAATGVATIMFIGSRCFWRYAMRYYTSASS